MIDTLRRIFIPYLYLPLLTIVFALIFLSHLPLFSATEVYAWPESLQTESAFFAIVFSIYILCLFPYFWVMLKDDRGSIPLAMAFSGLMGSFLLNGFLATLMIWLSALFAIICWIRHRCFHLHWMFLLLPLLFLVRLVYMWVGGHPFSRIEQGLSFVIFPAIFTLVRIGPRLFSSLLKVGLSFYLGVAAVFLVSFCVYAGAHDFVYPESLGVLKQHSLGYFNNPLVGHPTVFSMNIGMAVTLAFVCFMGAKRQGLAMVKILPFAFIFCAVMFLSSSRAGAVVSGFLLLAALIFSLPLRFWIKGALFVSLSGLGLVQILYAEENMAERMKDMYREQMMVDSKQMIKERWAWGRGVGEMSFDVYRDEAETSLAGNFNTPHNQYVTELLRFGVFGSLPFFVILGMVVWRAVVGRPRYALLFWLLIYLPMMWIETPFEAAMTVIPMVFWLCLFFSQEEGRQTQPWTYRRLVK